jgi:hypothetical protein
LRFVKAEEHQLTADILEMATGNPPARPLQPRFPRFPPLHVVAPPDYLTPTPTKGDIPIDLLPTFGKNAPAWETPGGLALAPVEELPSPSHPTDLLHRAPLRTPPTDEQLCQPPPARALLDSDGVPVRQDGLVATHSWSDPTRQAVVSADWVHFSHTVPVRTWRIRAKNATHKSGDIYFGVTEATSFEHPGATHVFDVHGNFRMGWHPLGLVHTHEAGDIAFVPGAKKSGTFLGDRHCTIDVTVDLKEQCMTLTLVDGSYIQYPMEGWTHARMCVTFSTPGDMIELMA